jgi:hypothetical protein
MPPGRSISCPFPAIRTKGTASLARRKKSPRPSRLPRHLFFEQAPEFQERGRPAARSEIGGAAWTRSVAGTDRSQQWGRLGLEWLRLAQRTSDPRARVSLLAVSQGCLDLAERDSRDPSLRRRTIQAAIGQGLRDLYSVPSEVPHQVLALLAQMNAQNEKTNGERGGPSFGF